ncbi:unnamed protein product [Medioppia subpectinata]|uniref:Uncharacterized protein n=1 Tax=Medioppia subpectinata TaxID=1979941 RepID=A0A7R9PTI5_9ACAR|nr:unnamed protein product [Medioppia subpectinata]CAG2100490.1 unnamed protein product [Medioppia subpectinata]
MILCVGPTASGKTLLLKRLQNIDSQIANYLDIPSTVSTVGTNIVFIKSKTKTTNVEEVGGSMDEIWHQYYADSQAIIFVIDSTNLSTIGNSCVSLFQMVSDINVKNTKPILIVLNKTDINCTANKEEIRYLLMIDNLIDSLPNQRIHVLEVSCVTGKVVEYKTAKPNSIFMRPYGGYLFLGIVGAVIVGHQLRIRYFPGGDRILAKVAQFGYKRHLQTKPDIK